jgi:diguanylate cyclase (GGDEF)-like protein
VIQAIGIARKIRSALSEPYRLNAGRADAAEILVEHRCTASIGIALLDSDEATLDDALSCADKAMYQAKREGPNSIRLLDTASRFAQGGLGGAGR